MALTDGLLAYYKLNQGKLLVDSSGNGKTLTNNGSVAEASDGKIGYCADYGSYSAGKCLSRSDALSIGTGNFSINMWLKYDAIPTSGQLRCPFTIRVNGTKTQYEFDYRNESGTPKYNLWAGGSESKYNITESTGTYYMLTLTYDGSNLRLYRNTSLIITQATGTNTTSAATTINFGNAPWGDDRMLRGKQDEIAVYNRVISGAEMSSLYNGGNGFEIISDINPSDFFQLF